MMRRLAIPLGLLLSFLLSFTGMAVASARALPQGERLLLCSGLTVVMVDLDAQDALHDPASLHLCPDGALFLFAALPAPDVRVIPPAMAARRLEIPVVLVSCPADQPPARARAPPVTV